MAKMKAAAKELKRVWSRWSDKHYLLMVDMTPERMLPVLSAQEQKWQAAHLESNKKRQFASRMHQQQQEDKANAAKKAKTGGK